MTQDLNIMARKLALKHIRSDVERGYSEQSISSSCHHSGCGELFVKNTGGDEFGAYSVGVGGWINGKRVSTDKIVVERVCGVQVDKVFSLHQLYMELQKGQLSLL